MSGAIGDFDTLFADLDQALEAHEPALILPLRPSGTASAKIRDSVSDWFE